VRAVKAGCAQLKKGKKGALRRRWAVRAASRVAGLISKNGVSIASLYCMLLHASKLHRKPFNTLALDSMTFDD
jgi:hypothetical protein